MKKIIKNIGIIFLLIILFFAITPIVKSLYKNYYNKSLKDYNWVDKNIKIVKSDVFGDNIYKVDKNNKISQYNALYRKVIDENIDKLKNEAYYTFKKPLLILDPYGTNRVGLNVYFETKEYSKLRYTIRVKSTNTIPEYSNTLYNEEEYSKLHEYQVIGLVAGHINEIEFILENKDGSTEKNKIIVNLVDVKTSSQIKLEVEETDNQTELKNGLYTILGNDSNEEDYVAMYDNNGILRMEIPILGYRAHKILFNKDKMYFSISQTKIVEMNRLGKITNIYSTGKYQLHHDYVFDDNNNILVLANDTEKNTEEDCIIKINLETKEVQEVIDFQGMFFSYVKTCTLDKTAQRDEGEDGLDWLHLNSIVYVDGDVILSSRETSSIIKIKDIYNEQKLEYILSDKYIWKDTKFEKYVYDKKDDFLIHAGQHSITYEPTEDKNIYYLHFYNNNYGKANSKPEKDYKNINIKNTTTPFNGDKSYYYVYKVNEYDKTFEKVNEIEVDYSGIVSNIQLLGDNTIINSGTKGTFYEYDKNNNLIKKYKIKTNNNFVYRVIKYDFTKFYF